MKSKLGIISLLLIFVYCLSVVGAVDLNHATDDVKTNDVKNINNVDNADCGEHNSDHKLPMAFKHTKPCEKKWWVWALGFVHVPTITAIVGSVKMVKNSH